MQHSSVMLNAASSESFEITSDQIKNLTPICRAAKNKRLMRLLQQRMIGNKAANFLGTKIQVYHRIAKRKKFNKLAICLMNRELYNSIRDLGCHTWVTGIQYGMIRELRRMRGRRILSSRCLENLEDIPTEILICMIWKQLQLIPVTRKAPEEKLQQIVRCYTSLIWAVSIRKGLQTVQKMQRKKQECETDKNINNSILSGSVNWKWRILQQSNKLLSKFLLKNNMKNNLKASVSQPTLGQLTPSLERHELLDNKRNILQVGSAPSRKTVDAIESKMKQDYNQVISEMKLKHANEQCLTGNKEDIDDSASISLKFQRNGCTYLDTMKIKPLNNSSCFSPENQPFEDQNNCYQTWHTTQNDSLQSLELLKNRQINCEELNVQTTEKPKTDLHSPAQNQMCGDPGHFDPFKWIPLNQTRYKLEKELFHLSQTEKIRQISCEELKRPIIEKSKTDFPRPPQNRTSEDKRNFDQLKFGIPPSQTRDKLENKSFHSPGPEKSGCDFIAKKQDTLKKEPQCSDSYFRYRCQIRDENGSDLFTLPTGASLGKSINFSSLSEKTEGNTMDDNLMIKTKDLCSEKLSKYMQELNSSNETISQEAREYCKKLLLSKFEDDLPKLRVMYAEKKRSTFPAQITGVAESKINANQHHYFPEDSLHEFSLRHNLQYSGGSKLNTKVDIRQFLPQEMVKESEGKNFIEGPHLTSCYLNSGNKVKTVEVLTNEDIEFRRENYKKKNNFSSEGEKDCKLESTIEPPYEWPKKENNIIFNLKHSQESEEGYQEHENRPRCQNSDLTNLSLVEKNSDYEETLRDLQKSISVHDAELRKLRFLNYVIDTNWEYFSPKRDKDANIIFDPDFCSPELCETNMPRLLLDQVRSEIWRKILLEEKNYLTETPCKDSEDVTKQNISKNEKREQFDQKDADYDQIKNSVEDFTEQFQNLCLKDTLKTNSCVETMQGIDQKKMNVIKNNNTSNLKKDCKKSGNILLKNGSDETNSDRTQSNKNVNDLKQNEIYTKQKLKSLKGQNSVNALEKAIKIERYVHPEKLAQDYKNSGGKFHKKQENCSPRFTFQDDGVRAAATKEQIKTPKKSKKITYCVDKRISKMLSPQIEGEQFCYKSKNRLRGDQTTKLPFNRNNLKSKRANSNLNIEANKNHTRSALHNDKKNTRDEKKILNNNNRVLKEKRTQVIYNNNNFITKSHCNLLDSKRGSHHEIQVQLKNISLAHGDAKKRTKTEMGSAEKNFSETDNFRRKLQEKHLREKLNSLETRLKKANRLNKLLAQLNSSSQVENIKKYLEVKNVNLEKNEHIDLHHLMLKKKKHLNKYLNLVNSFLVQLVSSETKKRLTVQQDFDSRPLRITRNSDDFSSDCGRNLSKLKTRLSRSETVNATYYIENQTVISHPHSMSGNYAKKYKRVSAPSLPFASHTMDSRRLSKTKAGCKSKFTTVKKMDSYWVVIWVAVAFLLYHSVSLVSLLKYSNQTYIRGLRYD